MEIKEFQLYNHNDYMHLEVLEKKIDIFDTPRISHQLFCVLEEHQFPNMIIDIRNVQYTDSSGMGLIISIMQKCKKNGNSAVLLCEKNNMFGELRFSRINNVLKVFTDYDEAEEFLLH